MSAWYMSVALSKSSVFICKESDIWGWWTELQQLNRENDLCWGSGSLRVLVVVGSKMSWKFAIVCLGVEI